ncbi:MAG: hypothetical protein NTV79_09205 [Candidatus Aureabacteria bacterium]|nr:hypothetical protein [Candidatus Auribacterota bacterium]
MRPLITGVLLALPFILHAAPVPAASDRALGKLAPWVIEKTEKGAEAEFLIVLSQQADLSYADELPSRKEKGWFVYETLLDTARSTQGPILERLKERGVPHRSYYIVNLIWAKGGRELALDVAAFPEVERIEGNPRITNALPCPAAAAARSIPRAIDPNISYVQPREVPAGPTPPFPATTTAMGRTRWGRSSETTERGTRSGWPRGRNGSAAGT